MTCKTPSLTPPFPLSWHVVSHTHMRATACSNQESQGTHQPSNCTSQAPPSAGSQRATQTSEAGDTACVMARNVPRRGLHVLSADPVCWLQDRWSNKFGRFVHRSRGRHITMLVQRQADRSKKKDPEVQEYAAQRLCANSLPHL